VESHFGFHILVARTEIGGYCSHCQVLRAQEMNRAAGAAEKPQPRPRQTRRAG
jgi:Fur family ferric uptake transcriptional regulator